MRCPSCGNDDDRVIDSRSVDGQAAIRRRRECEACGRRYTTYERVEETLPMVVKRDGRREPYDRQKLMQGVQIACRKRPVSAPTLEAIVGDIERGLVSLGQREVPSAYLGDRVMECLKAVDPVAYIRFASVYQSFDSIAEFARLLTSLGPQRDE